MKWTRNKPAEIGFYWVWQSEEFWPCRGAIEIVKVEKQKGELVGWVPYMDYVDPLSCDTWEMSFWQGPIEMPRDPQNETTAP